VVEIGIPSDPESILLKHESYGIRAESGETTFWKKFISPHPSYKNF